MSPLKLLKGALVLVLNAWHLSFVAPLSWDKDTYATLYGMDDVFSDACVTGKPAALGGREGRTEATGLGVCYAVRFVHH